MDETTPILILFADASHIRFLRLAMTWTLPTRMLLIGLPLTIAAGTAFAYALMPEAGLAMALFTAALLTPTDAALGQIVSSLDVPERLSQTINVESGLNDGQLWPLTVCRTAAIQLPRSSHPDLVPFLSSARIATGRSDTSKMKQR